jgi:hypothetical protein
MTQVYDLQPSEIDSLLPVREIVATIIRKLKIMRTGHAKTYFELPEKDSRL